MSDPIGAACDALRGVLCVELRLAELEAEVEKLRASLRFAAGLVSGLPQFSGQHPEDVLAWIESEAAKAGGNDAD